METISREKGLDLIKRFHKAKTICIGGRTLKQIGVYIMTDVTRDYNSKVRLFAARPFPTRHYEKWEPWLHDCVDAGTGELIQPPDLAHPWRIGSMVKNNSVGIQCFKSVTKDFFEELWNKPVRYRDLGLKRKIGSMYTATHITTETRPFSLTWPEAVNNTKPSDWLYKHDIMVYIFSDGRSMFVDPQDEFAYIADVLENPSV